MAEAQAKKVQFSRLKTSIRHKYKSQLMLLSTQLMSANNRLAYLEKEPIKFSFLGKENTKNNELEKLTDVLIIREG